MNGSIALLKDSLLHNELRDGSQFFITRDFENDRIPLLVKYLIEDNRKGLTDLIMKHSNWTFLFQSIVIEEDLLISPLFAFVYTFLTIVGLGT